jgi:hypothetical protein
MNENNMEQNKYTGTKIFLGLILNSSWNKSFLMREHITIQLGANIIH